MNALQNFAAQQLSKKQMNEVKGGYFVCFLPDSVEIVQADELVKFIATAPKGTECYNQD